ncbi:MAG: phosphotransferase [Patescibacteria group bacterium]
MEASGFPVAEVLEEGDLDGMHYFVESSLGEEKIGKIFAEDMLQSGSITDASFAIFLSVVEKFANAQLNTQTENKDFGTFASGIHLDILCNELPQYSDKIRTIFSDIKGRLSVFPFVLTHGDFNPSNTYPAGVIDFEDSFYGPFGYDIVGSIVHIDYFPSSQEYEYFGKYRFTNEQKQKYLSLLDSISQQAGLPKLSEFEKDFEFCRAVWLLVRMGKWPKL